MRKMQRHAATVGIENITLHDFRRTFGTRCAEGGMPVAILAEIMGHSSINLTARFYIHISNQSASTALRAILRGGTIGDTGQKGQQKGG